MIILFGMTVAGTILYLVSLNLEAQTSGKGSVEYNKFKRQCGLGTMIAWIGWILYLVAMIAIK